VSQAKQDASVQLTELAANEDWTGWARVALDKLADQVGVQGAGALPSKPDVVAAIHKRIAEHQRATVPDPPTVVARTYKVVGPHLVLGTKRGKTFTHVFTPEQEAALIEGGHITLVKETA